MKERSYRLTALCGEAWDNAIANVGQILGMDRITALRDWPRVEAVAMDLGVRFSLLDGRIMNAYTHE